MAVEDAGLAVALVVECYGVLSYAYSGTKRQVVTRIDVANTGSVGSAGTLVRPRVRVAAQLAEPLVTEWTGIAKPLPAPGAPAITWEDSATPLNQRLMASLTAGPPAELVVEVLAGDTVVAVDRRPLTVLQPNQWLHAPETVEALAGFVNVEDRALGAVLKGVNALLIKRTKLRGSHGYRRDSEHVHQVANAVYDYLRDLLIEETWSAFGAAGAIYAIQSPAEILAGKRATGLELALLVAACLAKAELDPVILLADSRVYAGYAVLPEQADGSWNAGEQAQVWAKLTPGAVLTHPGALASLLSLRLVQVLESVGILTESAGAMRTAGGDQRNADLAAEDLRAIVVVRNAWAAGISLAPPVPATAPEIKAAGTAEVLDQPTTVKEDVSSVPVAAPEKVPAAGEEVKDGSSTVGEQKLGTNTPQKSKKVVRDYVKEPLTEAELLTIAEAVEVTPVIWLEISRWAKLSDNLKPFQRGLLYDMGKLRGSGREPTIKQAYWALIALKEAYQLGFKPA